MDYCEPATGKLWEEITLSTYSYAVSDLKTIVEGSYGNELREARERATASNKPVRIAAKYEGIWYLVDIAYPAGYSE